jgi:hypothetical protein
LLGLRAGTSGAFQVHAACEILLVGNLISPTTNFKGNQEGGGDCVVVTPEGTR